MVEKSFTACSLRAMSVASECRTAGLRSSHLAALLLCWLAHIPWNRRPPGRWPSLFASWHTAEWCANRRLATGCVATAAGRISILASSRFDWHRLASTACAVMPLARDLACRDWLQVCVVFDTTPDAESAWQQGRCIAGEALYSWRSIDSFWGALLYASMSSVCGQGATSRSCEVSVESVLEPGGADRKNVLAQSAMAALERCSCGPRWAVGPEQIRIVVCAATTLAIPCESVPRRHLAASR